MTKPTPFLSPVPSIPYIVRCIFQYLANHPLFINPPIYHPTTDEQQFIKRYRLYSGINIPSDGVSVAVFPYSRDGVPSPASNSTSAVFDPWDLGQRGYDKVTYYVVVAFYYNDLVLGNEAGDDKLTSVPESVDFNNRNLRTSFSQKQVELEINPGMDILGEWLALTRLVINDIDYRPQFPIAVNSFEILYENLKAQPWERGRNVFFQEGFAMIRLDAHISRGWRDKFDYGVQDFNVNIN